MPLLTGAELQQAAQKLALKTKHYLITHMGHVLGEADDYEFYRALSHALREEIMINWAAAYKTFYAQNRRKVYYLSMEYLPGRFMRNNIDNICSTDIVKAALREMGRSYTGILEKESDAGLGNGGLGRLASCFLDSLATQHYPAQAYGLRYQYGIFEQQIWDGMQIEAPDCWLLHEYPWEFRRDLRKIEVQFGGRMERMEAASNEEVYSIRDHDEVWALPYDYPIIGYSNKDDFGVSTLRLWTTKESPRNFHLQKFNAGFLGQAAENTALTDVLYPNDMNDTGRRIRLKQEFLLVSASLQDILRHYLTSHENLQEISEKVRIQINDTHPSLVIAELTRLLLPHMSWKKAKAITETCVSYTNHTILSEALEQWDCSLFSYLLPRQYKIIERFNQDFCDTVRVFYPGDEEKVRRMSIIENGNVRMAHLAVVGSHKINGVAALHSKILRESIFKDFAEMYPDKFINITNGVTQRRWLLNSNPELANLITSRIGDAWITNFSTIRRLEKYATDHTTQQEFLQIKRRCKERFAEFLKTDTHPRDKEGRKIEMGHEVNLDSLFDVQVKRFHEYKRQLMNALHIVMLYQEMLENPRNDRIPRTFIFSGKAAAGYEAAKNTILFINCLARKINYDPKTGGKLKIFFIENYNVSRAEVIIPAADLSEQISTAGMEASGTGVMKLSMNGALTIGTDDGANIEIKESVSEDYWPFTFGASSEQIAVLKENKSYRSVNILADNPKIRKAVETLRDRTFAQNDAENDAFCKLYYQLTELHYEKLADQFYVLYDLQNYYETQKKVEELYKKPNEWAEYALHNIAGMGPFSTDTTIQNYAEKAWDIAPCPIDKTLLMKIRFAYSEIDQCRIY